MREIDCRFWAKVGEFHVIIFIEKKYRNHGIKIMYLVVLEGDECVFKENRGICREITGCPSILADVTARRLSYSEMVSCGFKGRNPVICCPDNVVDRVDTVTSTTEQIFTFE